MKFLSMMLASLVALLFIACNNDPAEAAKLEELQAQERSANDTVGLPTGANGENQRHTNAGPLNVDWDKKVIKTATLQVEVKDYNKYYSIMNGIVKRMGGYIAEENQSQSDYKTENAVAIKIPVFQFDEAISLLIKGTGQEKLNQKNIGSEDVSTQVVDTKSRLEAKRQVRLRYLQLLKQAKNMEEVLQVQKEINELQEQIELAAGRMSYLNQAAAFSTIHLTFYQVLDPSASSEKDPGFLTKLGNAFQNGWIFIQHLVLGLISIWPLFILAGFIWLIVKRWKFSNIKS